MGLAVQALDTYNRLFGAYPFNDFDLLITTDGSGGIEYPGYVMISHLRPRASTAIHLQPPFSPILEVELAEWMLAIASRTPFHANKCSQLGSRAALHGLGKASRGRHADVTIFTGSAARSDEAADEGQGNSTLPRLDGQSVAAVGHFRDVGRFAIVLLLVITGVGDRPRDAIVLVA